MIEYRGLPLRVYVQGDTSSGVLFVALFVFVRRNGAGDSYNSVVRFALFTRARGCLWRYH
jgi:hypothetical protein